MPAYSLVEPEVFAFVAIAVGLVLALAFGVASASRRVGEASRAGGRTRLALALTAAWLAVTWIAASSGILRRWDAVPPPFAFLVVGIIAVSCGIAFSAAGRLLAAGLPLWILIAIQGFRLPLELAMHAMYERGIMPVQMSYSGWNFDIVTGTTALIVAAIVRARERRWLVALWNVMGLALLVNVVTIAILSTPVFAYYGSDRLNTWVTYPPFIWLPAVMVVAALAGHLLIFRALTTVAGDRRRGQ